MIQQKQLAGGLFLLQDFQIFAFLNCPDNANRINKYHIKKLRNNSKKLPKIRYKNDSSKVRQKKSNFQESVQFFQVLPINLYSIEKFSDDFLHPSSIVQPFERYRAIYLLRLTCSMYISFKSSIQDLVVDCWYLKSLLKPSK